MPDGRVQTFLNRPLEGEWPYIWADATYLKVRQNGRIISVANHCSRHEQRRPTRGPGYGHRVSEAAHFWTECLRKLARRGLCGVKLVISAAHERIKAAVSRVLGASWQRCRVHFMRNALAYGGKTQRRVVSAFVGTAFAQDDEAAAKARWRQVADQLRPRLPKLSTFMDKAHADVLAYMFFPKD